MSKHTPGPWTSSNQGWGDGMADVIGPNREGIARMPILVFCPSSDGEVIDDPDQEAEYLANSHLVEAAPDLLEALEIVKNATIDIDSSGSWGSIRVTVEDWNIIKSAIARAKGESQ